ncbi:unnamed protein product [Brachionus calyciflorus]|uniref:CYTH domain-containing protein n=1 Tax=Brachionus calyciflorus TaxID=104777 RepID=A0A813M3M8_9BILA|nr:unnamed protein product [Brachionus calyciflorus]
MLSIYISRKFLERNLLFAKSKLLSRFIYNNYGDVKDDSNFLEIERKFLFNESDDLDKKLVKIGAEKIQNKYILDEYFDIQSNYMLLNTFLLRKRTICNKYSKWQLKYPTKENLINQSEIYYELNETSSIQKFIQNKLSVDFNGDFEDMIQEMNFKCFAPISYKRQSYLIKEMDLKVDLDQTDFSYTVGEIESLKRSDYKKSISDINILTNLLSLNNNQNIPGKLSAYLYRRRPDLFYLLLNKDIISQSVNEKLNKFFIK